MPTNTMTTAADLRMTSILTQEINLLLRDTANIRNTGYIQYLGSINNMGTDTLKVRLAGMMGRDSFESRTEVQAASDVQITDATVNVQVSRYSLRYDYSDLLALTSYGNSPYEIDPFNLAASIGESYNTLFAELTAAAAASATNTTSTTGTSMSVSTFFEAIYDLEQADSFLGAPGPFYACMHPKSLTELQASLRSEQNNIISQMVATEDMIKAKGLGYVGKLFGVDVYRSSHIDSDGTDYDNWMADAGALGYADGVPQIVGAPETMDMDKVVVELERSASTATTSVIGHCYAAISILNQNRLVGMLAVD